MRFDMDTQLRDARRKHLRAGSLPGQFGMDGLRLEEMRAAAAARAAVAVAEKERSDAHTSAQAAPKWQNALAAVLRVLSRRTAIGS